MLVTIWGPISIKPSHLPPYFNVFTLLGVGFHNASWNDKVTQSSKCRLRELFTPPFFCNNHKVIASSLLMIKFCSQLANVIVLSVISARLSLIWCISMMHASTSAKVQQWNCCSLYRSSNISAGWQDRDMLMLAYNISRWWPINKGIFYLLTWFIHMASVYA